MMRSFMLRGSGTWVFALLSCALLVVCSSLIKEISVVSRTAEASSDVLAEAASKVVHIEYCSGWGYAPRAASLAAAIKEKLGLESIREKGRTSSFEVTFQKVLVFSKLKTKRFPTNEEVIEAIEKLLKKDQDPI